MPYCKPEEKNDHNKIGLYMCLLAFDWQPNQHLILSANRDEFYQRPTLPLAAWSDEPNIIAGRDLEHKGTWLGVSKNLRFATLTNVRALGVGPNNPPSRGELVSLFLSSPDSPDLAIKQLLDRAELYAPFNFIAGDIRQVWYLTNYPEPRLESVKAGTHSLSNAQLDTPWPKAQLAQQQLEDWLKEPKDSHSLSLLLNRREPFADEQLPDTGVGHSFEKLLSAQFIQSPNYGTRCSTGLILYASEAFISETSWGSEGELTDVISKKIQP